MNDEFISEIKLSRDEIRGGLADGSLTKWRIAPDGSNWFRRAPMILAVPSKEIIGAPEVER